MLVQTVDDSYEHEIDYPKGHYENPLTDSELREKFSTGCDGVLSEERQEAVLAVICRIDEEAVSVLTEAF